MSRRAPRPVPAVSPDPIVSPVPVVSLIPVVSPDPAVSPDPVVSRPQGRQAMASFPNNITNIDPADYMWVKDNSIHTLCHKAPLDVEPTQALLWLVGDIDTASLTNADSYDSWTVNIRLPAQTNTALNALLKSGPYKSYT